MSIGPNVLAVALTLLALGSVGRPSRVQEGGDGSLAIIVHKSNPVDDMSRRELRRIFMFDTQTWPNGRRITVVLRNKGQSERKEAIRLICGVSDDQYEQHILLETFRGAIDRGPREILSASAMVRFVFNVPGAIGYVPASQVDDSVKVLRIEGLLPDAPGYALRPVRRASFGDH